MTTTAIICEFNPLHRGHKKLIDHAKSVSDRVVCIMSGNFTQRGLPACADKFSRARHAVLAGADLVVELPTIYAVSPANIFAFGGVNIANKLNADFLLFGSECGNIEDIAECMELTEAKDVNVKIKSLMQQGNSYPKAVSLATDSLVLDKPNNTLAVEYLRALKKTSSKITPLTLKRDSDYNSDSDESSTALRNRPELLKDLSFPYVQGDLNPETEKKYFDFAAIALSLLTSNDWKNVHLVTEGIENRFVKSNKSSGYEAILEQVKNKRFTRIKLQRIILNALLKIKNSDVECAMKNPSVEAVALAVAKGSEDMLSNTDKNLSPITKNADNLYFALSGKQAPVKLQVVLQNEIRKYS